MRRRHFHPDACKVCGKTVAEVGHISQTGLCLDHSKQRFAENLDAMKTMSGPYARRWRRAMAASVGGVLLDEAPADGQTRG